jgi:hypothetical protein
MKTEFARSRSLYTLDQRAIWKKRAALYGEIVFWAATFASIWALIPLQP